MHKFKLYIFIPLLFVHCSIKQPVVISKIIQDTFDKLLIDAYDFRGFDGDAMHRIFFSEYLAQMDDASIEIIKKSSFSTIFQKNINNRTIENGMTISFDFNYQYKNIVVERFASGIKLNNNEDIGILAISIPIFNEVENQAVFKVSMLCGEYCGYEELIFIKKENNKWIIYDQMGIGVY